MADGNISEYDPGLGEIRPDNQGAQARDQAAYRVNRLYTELGASTEQTYREMGSEFGRGIAFAGEQVENTMYHKEVSHGVAAEAGLMNSLDQQWKKTMDTADPNDPTVAAKFQKNVMQKSFDDFSKGFITEKGQDWAQTRIEELTRHYAAKTATDMGALSYRAIEVNTRNAANAWGNVALDDPAAIPMLLRTVDQHIGELISSSPNITGEQIASARETLPADIKRGIVRAGALGTIMSSSNPEAAAEAYGKKYAQYLDPADLKSLTIQARTELRTRHTMEMWQRQEDRLAKQERQDQAMDEYVTKAISHDKDFDLNKAIHDPRIMGDWRAKENLTSLVLREQKPETEANISRATFAGFANKIIADPHSVSLQELMQARSKDPGQPGGLTRADFDELRQWLLDPETQSGGKLSQFRNDAIRGVIPMLDHSTIGVPDPAGHLAAAKFMFAVRQKEEEYRNTPGKNPMDLFDPNKPDYVGNPSFYHPYILPFNQAVKDLVGGLTGEETSPNGQPQYGPPGGK